MGTTGTVPPGSNNSAASASNLSSPLYFTGISSFSSDFQSIIQRAVQIAELPVQSLENQQATINSQEQALTALEPTVSALGADVANLGMLASTQGLAASSSDTKTISVVNTGATSHASYKVTNITSLASAASETSLQGYSPAQAISASGIVNLLIGTKAYQFDLGGAGQNNIAGLEQAINNAHAGATATILTAGPSQYLVVTANSTGATTLQMKSVTPVDLITGSETGTETSLRVYADADTTPVSNAGELQLQVGSNAFAINLANGDNNLNGLVQAINNANAGVTASVQGNPGALFLSLSTPAKTNVQLTDFQNPTDLISNTNQGSDASFSLNGIAIQESTNNISDVIPGVSFTLLNKSAGPVTLSLATDPSQLGSALQTMVTDYNALVSQVQAQQGQHAGPLQGNLIVEQISSAMQDLVTFWNPVNSSSIHSLSDLGITFNYKGQLNFDQNTFNALSDAQISDAFKFLGSSTSGLGALANNFTQLSDPITGIIETQVNGYESQKTELSNQITTAQARVNQVQQSSTAQMQIADALVAQLEQQQNTVNASISSLNYVLYGRQLGLNGL